MRWKWSTIGVVIAIAAAALVGAVVLGQAVAKNDDPSSRAEYQGSVVLARDRIDFALARIGKSQSPEELVNRIDEAAAVVGASGVELADTNPPSELASAERWARPYAAGLLRRARRNSGDAARSDVRGFAHRAEQSQLQAVGRAEPRLRRASIRRHRGRAARPALSARSASPRSLQRRPNTTLPQSRHSQKGARNPPLRGCADADHGLAGEQGRRRHVACPGRTGTRKGRVSHGLRALPRPATLQLLRPPTPRDRRTSRAILPASSLGSTARSTGRADTWRQRAIR